MKSFRGRTWAQKKVDPQISASLVSKGITAVLADILAGRGIGASELENFMSPKLRNEMKKPGFLLDMDRAADVISDAVTKDRKIAIWSDYDCDGATSAAVLGWFLRDCGVDFTLRIPDRITEGYGPNAKGLVALKEAGIDLCISLDAGTLAFDALRAADKAGLDMIIIDHHTADVELPPALAVVNPNRKDQEAGLGHLCAAGVTFMACIAIGQKLQARGFYEGRQIPNFMGMLDIVALGTVCDVVPLIGLNRAFVAQGLKVMGLGQRPGILALRMAAGDDIDAAPTENTCGWILGPRINAGGRIGDSTLGARLLLARDLDEARPLANQLEQLNTERKRLEQLVTDQAVEIIHAQDEPGSRNLALAVIEQAHEGVVGISAARIKDRFDRPAIVLTEDEHGYLKGSARSVPGFNIGDAIIAASREGLLVKGGGHAMAGGLTIEKHKVNDFVRFMNAAIAPTDYARDGLVPEIDATGQLAGLSEDAVDVLGNMAPFGTGNPKPVVMFERVELAEIRILKEKHLKLSFRDGRNTIDAIIFNMAGGEFETLLRQHQDDPLDIAGVLEINTFKGRSKLQLMLDDVRLSA